MPLKQQLKKLAANLNINLTDSQIDQFIEYKNILQEWNQKMNLTAIDDDLGILLKHFIDSLTVMPYIKNERLKIIDIGTGAGFPGIPIKIINDKNEVILLDSLNKRKLFLDEVIKKLKLGDIQAVHSRAEDLAQNDLHREKYDVATARAVANLPTLLEYCLPYVKIGGLFIAMKADADDEVEKSKKALEVLGAKIVEIKKFTLPNSDINRTLIIIQKTQSTPKKYPRSGNLPSKEPIV